MAELKVDMVSAEETVWQGTAEMVVARTTEGEIGILAGHTPLLASLVPGEVRISTKDGEGVTAHLEDGGFLSVEHNRVSLVAGNLHIG